MAKNEKKGSVSAQINQENNEVSPVDTPATTTTRVVETSMAADKKEQDASSESAATKTDDTKQTPSSNGEYHVEVTESLLKVHQVLAEKDPAKQSSTNEEAADNTKLADFRAQPELKVTAQGANLNVEPQQADRRAVSPEDTKSPEPDSTSNTREPENVESFIYTGRVPGDSVLVSMWRTMKRNWEDAVKAGVDTGLAKSRKEIEGMQIQMECMREELAKSKSKQHEAIKEALKFAETEWDVLKDAMYKVSKDDKKLRDDVARLTKEKPKPSSGKASTMPSEGDRRKQWKNGGMPSRRRTSLVIRSRTSKANSRSKRMHITNCNRPLIITRSIKKDLRRRKWPRTLIH